MGPSFRRCPMKLMFRKFNIVSGRFVVVHSLFGPSSRTSSAPWRGTFHMRWSCVPPVEVGDSLTSFRTYHLFRCTVAVWHADKWLNLIVQRLFRAFRRILSSLRTINQLTQARLLCRKSYPMIEGAQRSGLGSFTSFWTFRLRMTKRRCEDGES